MWFRKTKRVLPTLPPEIWALIASQMISPGRLLRCCRKIALAAPMVKLPYTMYSRSPTIDELINWLQAGSEPAKDWLSNLSYLNLSACDETVLFWPSDYYKNTKYYGKPSKKLTIEDVEIWLYLGSSFWIFKRRPSPLDLKLDMLPVYTGIVQSRPGYNLTSFNIDKVLSIEVCRQSMNCDKYHYNKIHDLTVIIEKLPSTPELLKCENYLSGLTDEPYPPLTNDDNYDYYDHS